MVASQVDRWVIKKGCSAINTRMIELEEDVISMSGVSNVSDDEEVKMLQLQLPL